MNTAGPSCEIVQAILAALSNCCGGVIDISNKYLISFPSKGFYLFLVFSKHYVGDIVLNCIQMLINFVSGDHIEVETAV